MIELFYFMIPAFVANIVPVFARVIPWNVPVSSVLFGSHKTWRGLFFGVLFAVLSGFFLIDWPFGFSVFLWSFLVGFGALFGDLIKSFFKRRVGIKSGGSWFPFDQIDFSVGALLFGSFLYFPGWVDSFWFVVICALGHLLIKRVGFWLGINDVKL